MVRLYRIREGSNFGKAQINRLTVERTAILPRSGLAEREKEREEGYLETEFELSGRMGHCSMGNSRFELIPRIEQRMALSYAGGGAETKVFEMASDYGLILLEDGMLIDTLKGETVPAGKTPMPVTSAAQIAALDIYSDDQLANCVIRSGQGHHSGPFDDISGISDKKLIGEAPLNWTHGFTLSEIRMGAGTEIPKHVLDVPDVYFVQSGNVSVSIDGDELSLGAGDTLTVPCGAQRGLRNMGADQACLIAVRGGDHDPIIHWS